MSNNPNYIIVFDTETNGFSPIDNEIVQLSYILYDIQKQEVIYSTELQRDIVKIDGYISKKLTKIHGISKQDTLDKRPIKEHLDEFIEYCNQANTIVGHNVQFDINMVIGQINKIFDTLTPEEQSKYTTFIERFEDVTYCTLKHARKKCEEYIENPKQKAKLETVHKILFKQQASGQLHNALVDVSVTLRVYLKLTQGIDICSGSTGPMRDRIITNQDICNLIQPIPITEDEVMSPESDEDKSFITSYTKLENNELKEQKFFATKLITEVFEEGLARAEAKTIGEEFNPVKFHTEKETKELVGKVISEGTTRVAEAKALAGPFVKGVIEEAVNKICGIEITVCSVIIKSGIRKGQECRRILKESFPTCHYHRKTSSKLADSKGGKTRKIRKYKKTRKIRKVKKNRKTNKK